MITENIILADLDALLASAGLAIGNVSFDGHRASYYVRLEVRREARGRYAVPHGIGTGPTLSKAIVAAFADLEPEKLGPVLTPSACTPQRGQTKADLRRGRSGT